MSGERRGASREDSHGYPLEVAPVLVRARRPSALATRHSPLATSDVKIIILGAGRVGTSVAANLVS
jgi:hypothetical protein